MAADDDARSSSASSSTSTAVDAGERESTAVSVSQPPQPHPQPQEDRSELLEKARAFLTSAQVRHKDPLETRRFLAEKGLNDSEINGLMRELPRQLPAIPPRTYPQPPPSNLPYLLAGLARALTWITGTSLALVLVYYRFLLPRLTRSALARRALKTHQVELLKQFNESLRSLQQTQAEAFSKLPRPRLVADDERFAGLESLDDLDFTPETAADIPVSTILRLAIKSFPAQKATTDDLLALLDARYPWLRKEASGASYMISFQNLLSNDPRFELVEENGRSVWAYKAPPPPPEPAEIPLITSISKLKQSLPPPRSQMTPYQNTLQTLADLTGFITARTYNLLVPRARGTQQNLPSPQEEEIRKEIRSLKSLVLNRRTFTSSTPRTPPPQINSTA